MSGYVVGQILRLGGNLIVTRLLVPEMFGVMGIVTVILLGLTLFSDVGLLQNVVRSQRGEETRFLNTAWVVQIGRGGILCLVALLISWLLHIAGDNHWLPPNSTYADPVLPLIIAVMSIQPYWWNHFLLLGIFRSPSIQNRQRHCSAGGYKVLPLQRE